MYRLDGIVDRIIFSNLECNQALEEYHKAVEETTERVVATLCHRITENNTQVRINKIFNQPGIIEELSMIFKFIDKNLEHEQTLEETGVAHYLLAILINNFKQSSSFWKKFVAIIGDPANRIVLQDLNPILKYESVLNCMCEVIEEYLKCLCEVGSEFFIADVDFVTDIRRLDIYKTITVSQMILVINHLLNLPETSEIVAEKVFNNFELSPSFISYLKVSIRNLSL